jgi:type VI secretion system secreted protein Hcp
MTFRITRISALSVVALLTLLALGFVWQTVSRSSGESFGILTAVAASASSGYDMFLKLDTLPGGSSDARHRDEIEIDSFSFGTERGQSATRPSMKSFIVTLPVGKASPRLFLYTAGGLKITRGVLSVRRTGTNDDFLKWILTDMKIVSYTTVGNTHGDGVMDQLVLVPGKVEVELKPSDGSSVMKAGWDQRTGKSVAY